MPGVPDVYQGTEREYRALVDPDNRAPARFDLKLLNSGEGSVPLDPSDEKLALTVAALRLRRAHPQWFGGESTYDPLPARGAAAAHCVAFARSGEAVAAVTRLSLRLAETGGWRDTELPLPEGRWIDLLAPGREFTGHARVEELFDRLPVSLLVRAPVG
jgi:(1->4)-alpha-D-glucan 1-alpha-D-glucosylmutase